MGVAAGVITAILALTLVGGVSAAYADGDPASDVLVTQTLFDPGDADVPATVQAELEAVLAKSARQGFPIRVALIGSAKDLGTVTPLWYKPVDKRAGGYANYLDAELADLYHGQVLVVMPGSYGLHGPASDPLTPAERSTTAPTPRAGTDLGTSALAAVEAVARASGHPISTSSLKIRVAVADVPGTPFTVWLALALGLVLIAGAWWASLRARPIRHSVSGA